MNKAFFLSFFVFFIMSCTRQSPPVATDSTSQPAAVEVTKKPDFSRILRESIYFAGSLEREALKLILKNNSVQKLTLFSVLGFVVETNSGVKKATPFGVDCGQFSILRKQNTIEVYKSCVKPVTLIATIKIIENDSFFEVEFLIKEWANVVGLSVALTGENVRCQLKVKDKKLNSVNCQNWSYQTEMDALSSTAVKAREFIFKRDEARQFVIKGGFFKELVENKKLDIVVPMEGRIKIIEKEIKVIDEFIKKTNPESSVPNEKEKSSKKSDEENSKKSNEEEKNSETGQKSQQENTGEIGSEVSPQTSGESEESNSASADLERGRRGR